MSISTVFTHVHVQNALEFFLNFAAGVYTSTNFTLLSVQMLYTEGALRCSL